MEKIVYEIVNELDKKIIQNNQEINVIQSEIENLKKSLRETAEKRQVFKNEGNYEREAAEHSVFAKLTEEINAKEKRLSALENANYTLNVDKKSARTILDKYVESLKNIDSLTKNKKQLESDLVREEKLAQTLDPKVQAEIAKLEEDLQETRKAQKRYKESGEYDKEATMSSMASETVSKIEQLKQQSFTEHRENVEKIKKELRQTQAQIAQEETNINKRIGTLKGICTMNKLNINIDNEAIRKKEELKQILSNVPEGNKYSEEEKNEVLEELGLKEKTKQPNDLNNLLEQIKMNNAEIEKLEMELFDIGTSPEERNLIMQQIESLKQENRTLSGQVEEYKAKQQPKEQPPQTIQSKPQEVNPTKGKRKNILQKIVDSQWAKNTKIGKKVAGFLIALGVASVSVSMLNEGQTTEAAQKVTPKTEISREEKPFRSLDKLEGIRLPEEEFDKYEEALENLRKRYEEQAKRPEELRKRDEETLERH